jgi:hypothetical protein
MFENLSSEQGTLRRIVTGSCHLLPDGMIGNKCAVAIAGGINRVAANSFNPAGAVFIKRDTGPADVLIILCVEQAWSKE